MPMDKAGKYHMNPHHAKASDKAQEAKKPTEPTPGPDGSVGSNGDKGTNPPKSAAAGVDLGARGLDMPTAAPASPSGLDSPTGLSDMGGAPPQHPAHQAADTMHAEMGTMDPQGLADLQMKLQAVLQEITDLLGGGALQSQPGQSAPMLGGY